MNKYKYSKEILIESIKNSFSVAEVCRKLGIKPSGGNYKTINFMIKEYYIDVSHFTGQAWNVGDRYRIINPPKKLNEILVENSSYRSINNLRIRLIKEGIKEHKCECCGNVEWMNNPIKLELHNFCSRKMRNL